MRNDKKIKGKSHGEGSHTHKEIPGHMMDMMEAVIKSHKKETMKQSPFHKSR